jgi:soluble lytic murein transglycosylase-like protein
MRKLLCACVALALHAACAGESVYRVDHPGGLPEFTNRPTPAGSQLWMVFQQPVGRAMLVERMRGEGVAEAARRCCDAELAKVLAAAAAAHRLEEPLLRAVIQVESGFNPQAQSPTGAVGLMQLMPAVAQRYGVTDRFEIRQNVLAGARYLRELLDEFGDLRLALAAYNAGEGAVRRFGNRIPPYPETMAYVPAVLERYRVERERQRAQASQRP